MAQGGGDSGPAPGSESASNFTVDELMWIVGEDPLSQAMGNVSPGEKARLGRVNYLQQAGRSISASSVEKIKRLRQQNAKEVQSSNAAATEQKTLTQNAQRQVAQAATTPIRTPQTQQQVEQDMYTQFLGL